MKRLLTEKLHNGTPDNFKNQYLFLAIFRGTDLTIVKKVHIRACTHLNRQRLLFLYVPKRTLSISYFLTLSYKCTSTHRIWPGPKTTSLISDIILNGIGRINANIIYKNKYAKGNYFTLNVCYFSRPISQVVPKDSKRRQSAEKSTKKKKKNILQKSYKVTSELELGYTGSVSKLFPPDKPYFYIFLMGNSKKRVAF